MGALFCSSKSGDPSKKVKKKTMQWAISKHDGLRTPEINSGTREVAAGTVRLLPRPSQQFSGGRVQDRRQWFRPLVDLPLVQKAMVILISRGLGIGNIDF